MLRLDLALLDREGSQDVEADIPADDELWADTGLGWLGDVRVKLRATIAGTGELVASGTVDGALQQECRRCLEPVRTEVRNRVTLVLVTEDTDVEDDGGVYRIEPSGIELDLSSAVREETVLATNSYVVCDPECQGLCPMCGTNLNEGSCDCTEDRTDPRWAALRSLKDE